MEHATNERSQEAISYVACNCGILWTKIFNNRCSLGKGWGGGSVEDRMLDGWGFELKGDMGLVLISLTVGSGGEK
mgnify:CR=1 FL=1